MKKTSLFGVLATLIVPMALTSCSDSDEPNPGGENGGKGKFVFATTVQGSNATSYVLLTGESLDEGTLSPVNNGLLNDGATQWVFHKNYLYALTYNQGNAGTTRSYILGADGEMKARGTEYRISRFSSYGAYDNDILTMATGESKDIVDGNGYHAQRDIPRRGKRNFNDQSRNSRASLPYGELPRKRRVCHSRRS